VILLHFLVCFYYFCQASESGQAEKAVHKHA